MVALIPILAVAAYLAVALLIARRGWPNLRPYRTPAACTRNCPATRSDGLNLKPGNHYYRCYRQLMWNDQPHRFWLLDTNRGTALVAAIAGLTWLPGGAGYVLWLALRAMVRITGNAIMSGDRTLPAERDRLDLRQAVKGELDG